MKDELTLYGTESKASNAARFFKTGVGQYGEGDCFIGVTIPEIRHVIKSYLELSGADVEALLKSPEHEFRMAALLIWTHQSRFGDRETRRAIYERYIAHTRWINNWDLIDASAPEIVGGFLFTTDRSILDQLAVSEIMWNRRIAIVATSYFIGRGQPDDTLHIARFLLNDGEDLIQKATGWMLREVGKHCSQEVEEAFLRAHYKGMPRTMLRYAIDSNQN
jgi:3-methyladenine DNA glycosylase AlkD